MSGIEPSFWTQRPLAPIPTLAHLREQVLLHGKKRMPKWRFRLAPNLVTQLQPKPCVLVSDGAKAYGHRQRVIDFEGRSYFGANLTAATFSTTPIGVSFLSFQMYAEQEQPESWWWKPHSSSYQERDPVTRVLSTVDYHGNADRLLERLTPTMFAALPALMLSPNCLLCGKSLTDTASRARLIGPECAGTSSLTVPRLITLGEASA